jgi:predicted solute-binding protein
MLTQQELKDLKNSLPYGYFSKVEKRVNVSKRTVSNFFSEKNHRYNTEVHKAALDVIEESKELINRLKMRQNKIVNAK